MAIAGILTPARLWSGSRTRKKTYYATESARIEDYDMAWNNQERCARLRKLGVGFNETAYKNFAGIGRPSKRTTRERDSVKNICLTCTNTKCVYDDANY